MKMLVCSLECPTGSREIISSGKMVINSHLGENVILQLTEHAHLWSVGRKQPRSGENVQTYIRNRIQCYHWITILLYSANTNILYC